MYNPTQYIDSSRLNKCISYKEYAPSNSLSEYVSCYWSLNSQGILHNEPHRILPDGCVDIIFDVHNNFSFFTGISNKTEYLTLNGTVNTIGIRFLPRAIPFLLKSNASEFLNESYETKYTIKGLSSFAERIFNSEEMNQRLGIFENELLTYFKDYHANYRFSNILNHSLNKKGVITVKELSAYHGISEKQITRYFKEYIGLPTKEFLNIVRFQNLLHIMKDKSDLFPRSLDLGYYDQSHLIKDLNKYFGSTKNIY